MTIPDQPMWLMVSTVDGRPIPDSNGRPWVLFAWTAEGAMEAARAARPSAPACFDPAWRPIEVRPSVPLAFQLMEAPRANAGRWAPEERALRACVGCPEVYRGGLSCPRCGAPGEPLERQQ